MFLLSLFFLSLSLGTSIAIIFILTFFQGHLHKNFSDIQEVTQFCTTNFCSDPIRLLAESCVYATFQVRSVNQLDRREHSSYSRIWNMENSFSWIFLKIHVLYISDKTGNIIQTTDLKTTSFCIFLLLGWWIGFIFSPFLSFRVSLGKVLA